MVHDRKANSTANKRSVTLGVTGGIASGKSTVTALLGELGAATISADAIAHELTAPGQPLTKAVLAAFGAEFANPEAPDALDRAKLGAHVFADPEARQRLEAITHPPIIAEQDRRVAAARAAGARVIALEIPLLFEAGVENKVDKTLVAFCRRETQLARLAARSAHLSPTELAARVDSQMPLAEKAQRADFVVDTDKPLDDVRRQVAAVFDKIVSGKV